MGDDLLDWVTEVGLLDEAPRGEGQSPVTALPYLAAGPALGITPQGSGPADGGGGKSSSAASKVLKYDDLPDAIDPKLRSNNVYLIFTPYDEKKLEFSLYTNDTIMYHRYEPVVDGNRPVFRPA